MRADKAVKELRALAVARRERNVREISALDSFLETCESLISPDPEIVSDPLWIALKEIHGLAARATATDVIVDAAGKILRQANEPLARNEILRRLLTAGVVVGGDEPGKHLGTILWRSGVFESKERRYWFKHEDRPNVPSY
ncbi:hypothetical protein [Sphingomonas endolithica]|uniref:hypothetical protein n=1 Tax=Sphingomonas endolithica TaxID=2972485 RepID=UPI0021AE5778|nr:hypothetical protein [Sphingomonas sp. ZFBP2030]